jgi:hypothetical protein
MVIQKAKLITQSLAFALKAGDGPLYQQLYFALRGAILDGHSG